MPASPFRGPYPLSSIAASGYWQGGHDNLKKLYVWPLAMPKADILGLSNVHISMDAAFALRMFHVEHTIL